MATILMTVGVFAVHTASTRRDALADAVLRARQTSRRSRDSADRRPPDRSDEELLAAAAPAENSGINEP
ncbi:hypothetical protein PLICRDRAFT_36847 [Plicaturopsis crispa FD-325 SS-3]|nr:hypothetical protein PLICRDRAFT_36847 [Plicaturopsis crispa FD-325 SS-3]